MGELGGVGSWGADFFKLAPQIHHLTRISSTIRCFWKVFLPQPSTPTLGCVLKLEELELLLFLVIGISTRTLAVEFHVLGEGDSDRVEGCLTDGEGMEWNVGKRFGMGGLGKLKMGCVKIGMRKKKIRNVERKWES